MISLALVFSARPMRLLRFKWGMKRHNMTIVASEAPAPVCAGAGFLQRQLGFWFRKSQRI